MKKNLYFYISMVICCCFVLNNISMVEGKSKYIQSTALEENKVYEYDLDGDGKKEKIRYETSTGKVETSENIYQPYMDISLYINDIKKDVIRVNYRFRMKGHFYLIDLNKSDKKLELLCMSEQVDLMEIERIVCYNKGKIKKILYNHEEQKFEYGYGWTRLFYNMNSERCIIDPVKHPDTLYTDGEGHLWMALCSPYEISGLDAHAVMVAFYVKDNKLLWKKQREYEFYTRNPYISKYGKYSKSKINNRYDDPSEYYVLRKNCNIYEEANKKSKKLFMVKKDEKIKILKLIPCANGKEGREKESFAYIKDKKGRCGWIYIEKRKKYEYDINFNPIDGIFKNILEYAGGIG